MILFAILFLVLAILVDDPGVSTLFSWAFGGCLGVIVSDILFGRRR